MATTPPEQPQRPSYGYTVGSNLNLARMPIPGNAELLVYILALIVVAVVAWVADTVDPPQWVEFAKWATGAYLISRGIAKASRVLEQ
jgi:uncharacterized protein (DUF983 family)